MAFSANPFNERNPIVNLWTQKRRSKRSGNGDSLFPPLAVKPLIAYCDDNQVWLDRFKDAHEKEYDLKLANNGQDFLRILGELKDQKTPPSIILIDFFHPRFGDQERQKNLELTVGNPAIARLQEAIHEEGTHIRETWNPFGLTLLENARNMFPNTPIAIYTQQGVSVADDDELLAVSNLKGEWLLKGRPRDYESVRLRSMWTSATTNTKHARILKNTSRSLAVLIIVITFALSYATGKSVDYFLAIGTGLSVFFIPKIVAFFETIELRFSQKKE